VAEHDGMLYGLGVADVKLDVLCKLAALERLRDEALSRPVVLAGTYGEEVGRHGARLLVDRLRPLPAIALVGEPTGLRPCIAHKGYVELHTHGHGGAVVPLPPGRCWELRFEGEAAHSSQTTRGRSATDACLATLLELTSRSSCAVVSAFGGEVANTVAASARAVVVCEGAPSVPDHATCTPLPQCEADTWSPALLATLLSVYRSYVTLRTSLQETQAPGFDPPFSTVNNGVVRFAADGFYHIADVRLLPGEAPVRALRAHLDRLAALARGGRCELQVERHLNDPPFATRPGSAARGALEAALTAHGLPLDPELKSGTTEATVYAGAGIDTVIFGPGEAAGNIHKPNEHVPLDHLWRAIDVYADVIRRLCV
jgi:succinyl-diaminopimelate desuccinylase